MKYQLLIFKLGRKCKIQFCIDNKKEMESIENAASDTLNIVNEKKGLPIFLCFRATVISIKFFDSLTIHKGWTHDKGEFI